MEQTNFDRSFLFWARSAPQKKWNKRILQAERRILKAERRILKAERRILKAERRTFRFVSFRFELSTSTFYLVLHGTVKC